MRVAVAVTPKSGKDAVIGWVVDANGEREPYYEYNITTPYKDDLQRRLYTKKGA